LTFRVLTAAELEIIESAVWYDEQRANLGDEFLPELAGAFALIRTDPLLFGRLEQFAGRDDGRRCLVNRFPYIVIDRYRPEETLVVAVSHVRRKPLYWLERMA